MGRNELEKGTVGFSITYQHINEAVRQNFSTPISVGRLLTLYTSGASLESIAASFRCKHESLLAQIERFKLERTDTRTVEDLMTIVYIEQASIPDEPKYHDRFKRMRWMPRPKNYADYVRDAGLKLIHNVYGVYGVRIKQ